MRHLDPDQVDVHVLYNRLAATEPYISNGSSVLHVLPRAHNVHLRPTEFGPVGDAARSRLLRAGARSLLPGLRDCVQVLRYIWRHEIDVIHCEEGSRNGFYALSLARATSTRCIMHFHWKYGDWMSPVSRLAVKRCDALITVSSWTGRVIRNAGVRQRTFPVLNGIDVDRWDPRATDGSTVRHEFGLDADDPLVLMVAQLTEWKRQATLIEAFAKVATGTPRAKLLLVGREINPPANDTAGYAQTLADRIVEAGLQDRVILAGQRSDIPQILAAADVFALPSVDDPCALAHIEAMAMAKPIVAVRAGGTPELIEHGHTGLLSEADDVSGIAAHLSTLIDDPALRRQIGERGRARAMEYLNVRRMADEVEAVYRSVVFVDPASHTVGAG